MTFGVSALNLWSNWWSLQGRPRPQKQCTPWGLLSRQKCPRPAVVHTGTSSSIFFQISVLPVSKNQNMLSKVYIFTYFLYMSESTIYQASQLIMKNGHQGALQAPNHRKQIKNCDIFTIKTSSGTIWVSKFQEFITEFKSIGLVLDHSVQEDLGWKNLAKTAFFVVF